MGQYFYIVNLDKKEYLHPHNLGHGLKLWEICMNPCLNVLGFLLRQSSEGGGGDINKDYKFAGHWAGNRIVVVGDYDESKLYDKANKQFKEISQEIRKEWNDFCEGVHECKIPRIGKGICHSCGKETTKYAFECSECKKSKEGEK